MIGISWGGFNGLQVAARRPPALKAIITLCSTDDRYADDVHYMGGCVLDATCCLGVDDVRAATRARPTRRSSASAGATMWLERLEDAPPFIEAWLAPPAPRRLLEARLGLRGLRARSSAPVYAVGGWADGYSNAIPRLLAGLTGPRKGLIGPWAHIYPQDGVPGPAIGFLQEALRWWDHWLKGDRHRRSWTSRCCAPGCRTACRRQPYYAERPGRWVAEPAWPPPRIAPRALCAQRRTAARRPAPERRSTSPARRRPGRRAARWCRYGGAGRLPGDQRAEDGCSLCFDAAPLAEPLEILGFPDVELDARGRPAAAPCSRCGCATSRPTAPRCWSRAACST